MKTAYCDNIFHLVIDKPLRVFARLSRWHRRLSSREKLHPEVELRCDCRLVADVQVPFYWLSQLNVLSKVDADRITAQRLQYTMSHWLSICSTLCHTGCQYAMSEGSQHASKYAYWLYKYESFLFYFFPVFS